MVENTEVLHEIMEDCCICLGSILIPVEPICFPCSQQMNGGFSCFSMKRICLVCMEQFLELNRHRTERNQRKKCIFCPTTCRINSLPRSQMFRADYLLMDRDKSTRSCPYECGFSDHHLRVARHVFNECPSATTECECGHVGTRQELTVHRETCRLYHVCRECQKSVLETEMPRHMYYDHDKTKCFTCHEYIHMNHLSEHITSQCTERLITCDICTSFIRYKVFKNHLRRHIVEISRNVTQIRHKLREEEYTYQMIQKLIQNIPTTTTTINSSTIPSLFNTEREDASRNEA